MCLISKKASIGQQKNYPVFNFHKGSNDNRSNKKGEKIAYVTTM